MTFQQFLFSTAFALQNVLKQKAPYNTGELRNSIRVEVEGESIKVHMVEYWKYVEYGTPPHIIRPKSKKALHWKEQTTGPRGGKASKDVFAKKVMHPGTRPQPFVRPVFYFELPRILEEKADRYLDLEDTISVSVSIAG